MVKLVDPKPLTELDAISSIVWAMMEKIGKKELQPAALSDGSSHRISARIEGNVDGQAFSQAIEAILSVGHAHVKSSSVTPQVAELVAYLLSKLNRATRNRLLVDIPLEFAANDNQLPEANPVLVDDAKRLLKQLRSQKQVNARGAIRCEYGM